MKAKAKWSYSLTYSGIAYHNQNFFLQGNLKIIPHFKLYLTGKFLRLWITTVFVFKIVEL